MNEALTRIRYELGKDAVIISQRKIKKPGIKGIFSSKQIEVTAAVENYAKNNTNTLPNSMEEHIKNFQKAMNKELTNKGKERLDESKTNILWKATTAKGPITNSYEDCGIQCWVPISVSRNDIRINCEGIRYWYYEYLPSDQPLDPNDFEPWFE